jgi:hemerythrin-like domain-containing protein
MYSGPMTPQPSPHAQLLHSLALVHRALRRSLDSIILISEQPLPERDRGDFADFIERFTKFLHSHHDGEEQVVFPSLRAAAERLSMTDLLAHIASWQAAHESLLSRLQQLEDACRSFRANGAQEALLRTAREVKDLLFPHLDAEEAALSEPRLVQLMSAEQAAALSQAASKHGQQHGGPMVLMMYLHGLTDEEQTHFSTMPWFVRRVLVKRVWARGFRGSLKYAHNPSIAV